MFQAQSLLCGAQESRVPFVIPDPDGTFQYTYSNCTVFGQPGLA